MTPLRYFRAWLAIGVALVGWVIWLSLAPDTVDLGRFEGVKVGHLVAYGVLMLWFAQLVRAWPARIGVAAGFALMGVALEYAQAMTGYRTFAYADMRDNALGVALGLAMGSTQLGMALARVEQWMDA